jgi:type I restriction enzyme M protein
MRLDDDELETHYRHILESLGKQKGMLGIIFRKAQKKISDPAKLRRLIVDLIDKEQWSSLSADVKATPTNDCSKKRQGGERRSGPIFFPAAADAAIVDVMHPDRR